MKFLKIVLFSYFFMVAMHCEASEDLGSCKVEQLLAEQGRCLEERSKGLLEVLEQDASCHSSNLAASDLVHRIVIPYDTSKGITALCRDGSSLEESQNFKEFASKYSAYLREVSLAARVLARLDDQKNSRLGSQGSSWAADILYKQEDGEIDRLGLRKDLSPLLGKLRVSYGSVDRALSELKESCDVGKPQKAK